MLKNTIANQYKISRMHLILLELNMPFYYYIFINLLDLLNCYLLNSFASIRLNNMYVKNFPIKDTAENPVS